MKKFRKSIVESMKLSKIHEYGFYSAYGRLERSLNTMEKEGDVAEALAVEYLKKRGLLGASYETNAVIELRNILIETDIIDHTNKIIYEVKSRKLYETGKSEIRKKWHLFQHQRGRTPYVHYKFYGIVVTKQPNGSLRVHRPNTFANATYNHEKQVADMQKFYDLLSEYKKIKRPKKP